MKRLRIIQFTSDSVENLAKKIRGGGEYKDAIEKADGFVKEYPELFIIDIDISKNHDSVVVVYMEEVEE